MEFVVPPALSSGDRVALLAPCATPEGNAVPEHVLDLGVERLREQFGLELEVYDSVRQSRTHRYAHPEERAAELERAFRDPDIAAVIAVLGGNDQLRILKHLDPEVFREHPTRFFGTSDNTSFAAFLWRQGVVSFYGGTLYTDIATPGHLSPYTRRYLERAFFEEAQGDLDPAEEFTDQNLDWNDPANLERTLEFEPAERTWLGGDSPAAGRTWGGCLEVVDSLLAADRCTPDDRLDGGVLLLETSEELPSVPEVRRTLVSMGERGTLGRVGAVLVGRAKARSHADERPPDEREAYRERQREAVESVVGEYNPDAPIVCDIEFGHTTPTAPVPVGGRGVVDPAERRIAFPGESDA